MQLDIRDDLHIRHPRHTLGELTHDQAWKAKDLYTDWKRKQKLIKKVREQVVPEKFKRYDEEFDKVVTFEQQLQSLKTRGFLRPYKAYDPPPDLDQRWTRNKRYAFASQILWVGFFPPFSSTDSCGFARRCLRALARRVRTTSQPCHWTERTEKSMSERASFQI